MNTISVITQNEPFIVICKTIDDNEWQPTITTINTPATLLFSISSTVAQTPIKKIVWDLGNGNLNKSFTNRKQDLSTHYVQCRYRKSHNSTITIQASVYTEDSFYVTPPVSAVTVNKELKEYYIEPEEFKQQIIKYYKTNVLSNEVAESIYKIANRLAFAPNFINYTYREEMVGDAVVRMVEALTAQKFDPLRGNPFSYFTKIAFNAFCYRIKKEKKMRDALASYQSSVYNEMVNDKTLPYQRGGSGDSDDSYEDY